MKHFIWIALVLSIWLSVAFQASTANLPAKFDMKGTKPSRPFGKANPIRLLKKTNTVPLPPAANRPIRSEYIGPDEHFPPVYLLISTSSKIYCMKMPNDYNSIVHSTYTTNSQQALNSANHAALNNYTIIYEEANFASNWITDVFYVKSENLIYVNVYNSSASSSEIFTLKYDSDKDTWTKKVLYKDQTYCLGITYNEEKRELYWTSAKSIVSGSSFNSNGRHKVLFNLEAAKKLLYLKYDKQSDSIYVSTLNYVYQCSLKANSRTDCRIIARDLLSARGLYLDSINRLLYVVDHKKKRVQRIKLRNNNNDYNYYDEEENSLTTSTLVSSETTPDMGDIFYMCIYNRTYSNLLIWSEFSGKIKIANLNETSNYKVLFATNEYTYSVALMDNSTHLSHPIVPSTTVPVPTTTQAREKPSDLYDTGSSYEAVVDASAESRSKEVEEQTTTQTPISFNEIKATLLTWPRSRGSEEKDSETTESPLVVADSQVTVRLNEEAINQYRAEENIVPEFKEAKSSGGEEKSPVEDQNKENYREERVDYSIDRNQSPIVNKIDVSSPSSELMQSLSSILESTTSTTPTSTSTSETSTSPSTTTTPETTTTSEEETAAAIEVVSSDPPKQVYEYETMSQRGVDSHHETKSSRHQTKDISQQAAQQHVVNLKKVKTQKSLSEPANESNKPDNSYHVKPDESLRSAGDAATPSSLASAASSISTQSNQGSSFNFLRSSSSQLNVALYIVISLLCFSLIINVVLLYISKLRERQGCASGSGSGKLILTHEIRDKSETMPSQRSINTTKTTNSTGELGADCNINLLNSNGSASGIDSDH